MTEGVLVAYATRHDSTRGIASAIAEVLRAHDLPVELEPVAAVASLSGCRAVILGSAIYDGEWLLEVEGFLTDHAATLSRLPVWLFVSGPLEPVPANCQADIPVHLVRAIDEIRPTDDALFAGALQPHHRGAGVRVLSRLARIPAGDHRDWQAIERWAEAICSHLGVDADAEPAPEPTALLPV